MFSFIFKFFNWWTSTPTEEPTTTSKTIYGFSPEEINEMCMDVANALYEYFDQLERNSKLNVLTEQTVSDSDSSSKYEYTLSSLNLQINAKQLYNYH